jgi:hypothetical protein
MSYIRAKSNTLLAVVGLYPDFIAEIWPSALTALYN